MNKKMRELLAKIKEKNLQARKFQNEGKVAEAKQLIDEINDLKMSYENEKALFEMEKEQVPDDPKNATKANGFKAMAKKAEDRAPIKIRLALLRSIPRRIKEPSPPAPIKAARVAVPIIITAAVRIPDMMTGMAKGISNFLSRSHLVIPKAIPASSRLGSIPCKPVMVF